jgi:hypothetical protein
LTGAFELRSAFRRALSVRLPSTPFDVHFSSKLAIYAFLNRIDYIPKHDEKLDFMAMAKWIVGPLTPGFRMLEMLALFPITNIS